VKSQYFDTNFFELSLFSSISLFDADFSVLEAAKFATNWHHQLGLNMFWVVSLKYSCGVENKPPLKILKASCLSLELFKFWYVILV